MPRGAQEEASRGVCQLRRVLQEMLRALEGRINSCHFFFLYPISQDKKIKNASIASLLNRLKSIVFFPKTMSPKEKGKFEDMAKLDKVRYEKEMKNYIPPKGHKKKRFKDPNAPKRPPWVPSSTRSLLFYLFDIRYKLDQNSWINDAFFPPTTGLHSSSSVLTFAPR